MGHVRTIPQVDQAGQKSGNTLLEITYGGLESPFGGIDSSAPAAYIDPKCFADAEGFLVIDNKLVAASLVPLAVPTLWGGVNGVLLLKLGTFFSSTLGQVNYALGYTLTTISGPPEALEYNFYLTVWDAASGATIDNEVLNLVLFRVQIAAIPATLTLPVLMGESSTYIDSGSLGINYGASGSFVGTVNFAYTPGMTVAQMVTGIAAAITSVSGSSGFTAAPSTDGLSVVLTAVTPGAAGNNLQVADASSSSTSGNPPAFYFPSAPNPAWTNLQNGKNAFNVNPPQGPFLVSTAEVGGVLYFANIGPFILKYTGINGFTISTAYNGVQVLRKFAGSLIGLGTIAQLGIVIQNADMIFSWSSALNLDEWSPVDANGNVTGAGFEQLGDIGDALTGLIVSNNTAYIIRAQGLSYAIATSSGSEPFQVNHIGISDQGEGAQRTELVTQYDQTGAFIGNSDIFQVSGSISSIGQKIKAALFSALEATAGFLSSVSCAVFIGGDTFPLVLFMIDSSIYAYNPPNNTWMKFSYTKVEDEEVAQVAPIYLTTSGEFLQSTASLALQGKSGTIPELVPPVFFALKEGLGAINNISIPSQITFPQEELLFGRDVVIDAIYIALWASIGALSTATLNFYFNGVLFGSLVLGAEFNTLVGNPTEIKVFPSLTSAGTGVFTAHSPQLQIQVVLSAFATASIRISKIQLYGSFEPNQRPV